MWLNCNLGKVNLATTLAGQRFNPRQAAFCGAPTGSAGAYMWLHISALLCFAMLIFADHCNSRPVISAGFCWLLSFVSSFSSFDLAIVFIGLYQSCLDYGFMSWILNWLVCCLNNDVNSSVPGSADSGCSEGFSSGRKSGGSTSSTKQFGWITFCNTIFCSGCWGRSRGSLVLILQCIWLLVVRSLIPFSAQCTSTQSFVVPSFVNTFVWFCTHPVLLLLWALLLSTSAFGASSTFIVPLELLSMSTVTTPLQVLHQPFVVGPGFSPGPTKIVTQIVSGKFVKLSNLLQATIRQSTTEP